MKRLYLKIETYSGGDRSQIGDYRYAELPDARILLLGYAMDDDPVRVIDVAHGETIPAFVGKALKDKQVVKYAYDAAFTRICLSRSMKLPENEFLPADQWRCIKSWMAYLGLPTAFEKVDSITHLNTRNYCEARDIIRRCCYPLRGESFKDYMKRFPEESIKWAVFREYIDEALTAERNLLNFLKDYPMPAEEWECYFLNERINDRGVAVDSDFIHSAMLCDRQYRRKFLKLFENETGCKGLDADAFQNWLKSKGIRTDSLSQSALKPYRYSAPATVQKAIAYWRFLTMASTRKYRQISDAYCNDGRLRGLYSYCGAHNGRFGNRIVQTDNLPVCRLSALHDIRDIVRKGMYDDLEPFCRSVADAMAELLATSFVPAENNHLFALQYAALEESVLRWLANITEPEKSSSKNSDEKVFRFMNDIRSALQQSVVGGVPAVVGGIHFLPAPCDLKIQLPSGRMLTYYNVDHIYDEDHTMFEITYDGVGEKNRWRSHRVYSANIVGDIVQGIARDIMVSAMCRLEKAGFRIVMHFPSMILIECTDSSVLGKVFDVFRISPAWADKLNLTANAYRCPVFFEKSMETTRKN